VQVLRKTGPQTRVNKFANLNNLITLADAPLTYSPVGNSDGVAQLVQSLEPTIIAGLQTLLQLVQAGNAAMNTSGQPIDFDNTSTCQTAEAPAPDQVSQQNSPKLPLPLTSHEPVTKSFPHTAN
jgi:hypothetical protein